MTKGLSFLTILILTRSLGSDDYGKYSFIFVTVALCSALFDFGMENTAVRFAAREKDLKQQIFGLYLSVKLCIVLGLVLFFFFGGNWLFGLMNKSAISHYMPFLITGLIGESLFFVNDTYLQANQRFQLRALLNIARYSVVLLYVGFLLMGHQVTLESVFYVYLVPLLFSLVFLRNYWQFIQSFLKDGLNPDLLKEIVGYERWMFAYSICNNLLGRMDFFILSFWVGFQQLGIYNAAGQLCAIVSFLPMALGKVLLPALSKLTDEEICHKTRKIIRITNLICLAALLTIPLMQWVVPIILGAAYISAIPILQILLVAFILSLMSMPYEQSLYSMGQPRVMTIGRYIQLACVALPSILILSTFGATYGSYVVASATLFGRFFYLMYARWHYMRHEQHVLGGHRETVLGVS